MLLRNCVEFYLDKIVTFCAEWSQEAKPGMIMMMRNPDGEKMRRQLSGDKIISHNFNKLRICRK